MTISLFQPQGLNVLANPQGPFMRGPAGLPGLTMRGAWSIATAYAVNDGVIFGGSSYYALAANTGSQPPSGNWGVLAAGATAVSVGLILALG